jgi:hypothetical protein
MTEDQIIRQRAVKATYDILCDKVSAENKAVLDKWLKENRGETASQLPQ